MAQQWKRSGIRSALEVVADLATIVATVLALLTFLGVDPAHSVLDGCRPAAPASSAPHPIDTRSVPDVRGLVEAEAASELEMHGFGVEVYYAPATDGADVGRVLGQAPSAGIAILPGRIVAIVIGSSSGRWQLLVAAA